MIPLVRLTHLNKIYYSGEAVPFQALKDVSLKIDRGEFVAIVGPSGSGKSTLMHIVGLLDRSTSGSYRLEGQDVAYLGEETLAQLRNKKIGFVFQTFNLLPRTSAWDNVALPLIYCGLSEVKRKEKARTALQKVGLGDKLHSFSNQLSGGEQQRVAIARALVNDPEIILADEPTGNLDSKTGGEILAIFRQLHRESRTLVLITHDPAIAKQAKRVIALRDGRIVK